MMHYRLALIGTTVTVKALNLRADVIGQPVTEYQADVPRFSCSFSYTPMTLPTNIEVSVSLVPLTL